VKREVLRTVIVENWAWAGVTGVLGAVVVGVDDLVRCESCDRARARILDMEQLEWMGAEESLFVALREVMYLPRIIMTECQ